MVIERGNLLLRILDKYLGIPLVSIMSLFHKKSAPPKGLQAIGVLCLGCIGDMVLFSGPLADLAREHPQARLTIFCSETNLETARMVPGAALVVPLPVKNPIKAAALVRQHGPFDAWLDSGQWPRLNAILSFTARARHKIGFMSPGQHRHYIYDVAVPHSRAQHELDNFRQLFAGLGIDGQSLPLLIPLAEVVTGLPGGWPLNRPYAVLHMFPGGHRSHMKEWPQEHWRQLALALVERGLTVLLSGGPEDREGNSYLVKLVGAGPVISLAGSSLSVTAEVLRLAAFAISVNTGIMHLAAALDTPLVSLQGPTSALRWGAVAQPGRLVSLNSPRPCAPCLHLGFEYACQDNACMRDITVADVLEAVDILLAGDARRAS